MRRVGALAGLAALALIATATESRAGSQTFGGFECPTDCKGHAEGFKWGRTQKAARNGDCAIGSKEFIEGCLAFVANPMRADNLDDAGAPIDW